MRQFLPAIRRQRERNRADRAYVILNGTRHYLGTWGSPKAERRYLALLATHRVQELEVEAPVRPTVAEVMVPFLRFVLDAYKDNPVEVAHFRTALKIL